MILSNARSSDISPPLQKYENSDPFAEKWCYRSIIKHTCINEMHIILLKYGSGILIFCTQTSCIYQKQATVWINLQNSIQGLCW